jgi:hypothetical protein
MDMLGDANEPLRDTHRVGDGDAIAWLSSAGAQALLWSLFFVIPLALLVAIGPVAIGRDGWFNGFRNYFADDQLSYAAFASNVAHGHPVFVEPFTSTGSSYDPSMYYALMGLVSRATGLGIAASWNVLAITLVLLLVSAGAYWGFLTTRRWWGPTLALAPLLIGTVTWVKNGTWGCKCGSPGQAVVWPVNAALYTFNGEVAGLIIGAVGMVVLLSSIWQRDGDVPGVRASMIGFGIIGVTANIHTYAFFSALAVAVLVLWMVLLRAHGTHRTRILSTALLLLALPLGRLLSEVGSLLALGAFALPLAPGAIVAVRKRLLSVGVAFLAVAVGGGLQFIHTVVGFAEGDAFLSYRAKSGGGLPVGPVAVVAAHLPIVLLVLLVVVAGSRSRTGRDGLPSLVTGALALAVILMGWNGLWGFDQEPYRFVIDEIFYVLVIVPPLAILAVRSGLQDRRRPPSRLRVLAITALAAGTLLVATASLAGTALLSDLVRAQGTLAWSTQMQQAAQRVAERAGPDLVVVDPCLAPTMWKMYTGTSVLYFNMGIAWPARFAAVSTVRDDVGAGRLIVKHLRAAQARYVLTSSICTDGLAAPAKAAGLRRVFTARWSDAPGLRHNFVLWTTSPDRRAARATLEQGRS